MRAARIENGVVVDLWEVPSLDCYGDLYTLVEAPDWVQLGATWDGENFVYEPQPPLPSPPLTCSPWQIRKALNQLGLRDAVEAYVAASDQSTKDGWEFALEFREDDALVLAAQAALGLTDADRTNLFTLARTL